MTQRETKHVFRHDSLIIYLSMLCLIIIDISNGTWFGATAGTITGIGIMVILHSDYENCFDKLLWRSRL